MSRWFSTAQAGTPARGSACHPTSRWCRCRPLAELNPVERVWLYLKQRFLSLRLLNDYQAIVARIESLEAIVQAD